MERFKSIDWHPAIEDIVDDVFIRDERIMREGAMYRIMNDCFKDPFDDIEREYAEIDEELLKQLCKEADIATDEEDDTDEEKSYIPGIRKMPFNFPKRSFLTKPEQIMCLRVLLRLSNNQTKLSNTERAEMDFYMKIQNKISEEQKEFLEFAKSKWNGSGTTTLFIKCNRYIVSKWQMKMKKCQQLPRYYIECTTIPLSVQKINVNMLNKKVKVAFKSHIWQGSYSEVKLPKLDRMCKLSMNPELLIQKYQPCVASDKATQHFRLPVSEDEYCENFAKEKKADIVISSSGLKCLLNNIDPNHSNTWVIPVVIKSHQDKNVVYIDKKLPPVIATVPEKNTWVYKYILRHRFVDVKDESKKANLERCKKRDKSEKSAVHSDSDNSECSNSSNSHLKIYEEDLYLSDTEKADNGSETGQNVSYKLFTIGPAESLTSHERITHHVKEYQMLVRKKTDGFEVLPDGKSQPLILAPKMEHQLELGAEATTLEEGMHQWTSLIFTPRASLARVRIAADTSEVIQTERHTASSINSEMQRLYDVKLEDSLSILHNIIEELLSLPPGRYIMRHIPQNGPFAFVYKQVEEHGKNVFDLHTICQSTIFQTVPDTPWPVLDKMMTTPAIRCFKKMPAMFNPSCPVKYLSRGRPKKKCSNQAPLRRSLRKQVKKKEVKNKR